MHIPQITPIEQQTKTIQKMMKNNEKTSIIMLTETWLRYEEPPELNKKFNMNTYSAHRPAIKTGGGALIACTNNIAVERSISHSDTEISNVAIYSPNKNLFLASIYLSPSRNHENAIALQEVRNFVLDGPQDAKAVVYGDFNLNCLEYKRDPDSGNLEPNIKNNMFITIEEDEGISKAAAEPAIATKLVSIADELEWQQIVELPTLRKYKSNEKSYLDRIFCNFNTREGVKHTETSKTRHDVIEFDAIFQTKITEKKKSNIQRLNTKAVDFMEVRQTILDANLLENV